MKTIDGIVSGPIEIAEDTELKGIVTGAIMVAPGVHVVLSGIVEGEVTLGEGATADTPGIFKGAIRHA